MLGVSFLLLLAINLLQWLGRQRAVVARQRAAGVAVLDLIGEHPGDECDIGGEVAGLALAGVGGGQVAAGAGFQLGDLGAQ